MFNVWHVLPFAPRFKGNCKNAHTMLCSNEIEEKHGMCMLTFRLPQSEVSEIPWLFHWNSLTNWNIGTLNVLELFWMLQCNFNASAWPYQEWWIYLFRPKCRLDFCAKLGIAVYKWKRETLRCVDPHAIYSLSPAFPCYIWCKLNRLLK